MIYGYARVSTRKQASDGNSLEAQHRMLEGAGCTAIYSDAFTGTSTERPEFEKLLAVVRAGDTIVACKLDRISRSASQGIKLVDSLLERGVAVNILNMGTMDNTPTGKLIRNIMFAFAEFERDMIVTRTQEGKAVARSKEGYKDGRPMLEIADFQKFLEKQKRGLLTVDECCAALDISRSTWYDSVRKAA